MAATRSVSRERVSAEHLERTQRTGLALDLWLLCCCSFGNVTDVLFDECTIGDDEGSSPHAFFFKMHSNCGNATKFQCRIGDMVVRNTKLGRIRNNTWQDAGHRGDFAIQMALTYADPPIDPSLPQPLISNITFVNVTATETFKVPFQCLV